VTSTSGQRVVLVTGGGGGIGAALAVELGRRGDHVVTVDPLVSVDGADTVPEPEETTAGWIRAAGGSAEASNASVTDREAVRALVDRLVEEHGRIDAVVNAAGITRPTGFAKGAEADWAAVLAVHLDGYVNVLDAVLPHMVAAGHGHVLGVTSGSGWRAADAGAYSCAKRAVASLTWQLGAVAPPGVTVNAISPIAMTRMVTAALGRAGAAATAAAQPGGSSATGGLSLGSMPAPEDLGPLGAALAGHGARTPRGQVLFAAGSEVAVVAPPRLLEVVRTSDVTSIETVVAGFAEALTTAEASQTTGGGANPRFATLFDQAAGARSSDGPGLAAVIVSDRPDLADDLANRLQGGGARVTTVTAAEAAGGAAETRGALATAADHLGGLDVVVTAIATPPPPPAVDDWEGVLAGHRTLAGLIRADAAWARACADHASATERPLRLVGVVDATSPGGRSRAQAAAQLARASRRATGDRVAAFTVALEGSDHHAAVALVDHLATAPGAPALAGAELAVGSGWLGLRSHPRATGAVAFGGPQLPDWFADVLAELCP
jgi:NAD(P)-dependent dehydrogenase (short-subunit alcohol dehydrogenase family)